MNLPLLTKRVLLAIWIHELEARKVSRPGITDETLGEEGIFRPTVDELKELGFYKGPGYLIPYFDLEGNQVADGGKPYFRQRLDSPLGKRKYHQIFGTRLHLYIPAALRGESGLSCEGDVVVVEGEHKATSLCEAGIPAVGVGGIQSLTVKGEPRLIPELEDFLKKKKPARILFLGDADTAHNLDFSRAALKFASLHGETIFLPRIPVTMAKGIDDIRDEMESADFKQLWQGIAAESLEVKPAPSELVPFSAKEEGQVGRKASPEWNRLVNELSLKLFAREVPNVLKLKDSEKKTIFRRLTKMAWQHGKDSQTREQLVLLAEDCGFTSDFIRAGIEECQKAKKENREPNIDQFYDGGLLHVPGLCDADFPEIECADDFLAREIATPAEIVEGLLHAGMKGIFAGDSKSGKTWAQMDLALSVATGSRFWGRETIKSKVLYINMELHESFSQSRFREIKTAKGVTASPNLHIWNLRGRVTDLNSLLPRILKVMAGGEFGMVILDPIYKLYGDLDENTASDITKLCNMLDLISFKTGAATIFAAHFAKGNSNMKAQIDRMSGSGVFARDPDSIITMTPFKEKGHYVVEASLRNFKELNAFVIERQHPLFVVRNDITPGKVNVSSKGLKQDEIVALLEKPMTPKEFEAAVVAKMKVSRRSFFNYLKAAEKDGKIQKTNEKWERKSE